MKTAKLKLIPAPQELRDGYTKAVTQGLSLMEGALELVSNRSAIALALAEIGQEEIGKSLSLLAAIALPTNPKSGEWFWKSWTQHRTKAHRAFLYELISPVRIVLPTPGSSHIPGSSFRAEIQHEKEAGFYVDFDSAKGRFLSPVDSVNFIEAFHRIATLLYLGVTAKCVHNALAATEALDSHRLFAEIALRICTETLYQQQMPTLLQEFSERSTSHARIMSEMRANLSAGERWIKELLTPDTLTDAAP